MYNFALRISTLQLCTCIPTAIEASGDNLGSVLTLHIDLDQRQQEIETALRDVADLAMSVLQDCQESGADCSGLPNPSIFVTVANFSKVRKS